MAVFVATLSFVFLLPLAVNGYALFPLPYKNQLFKWPTNPGAKLTADQKAYEVPLVVIPYTFNPASLTPREYASFLLAADYIQKGTHQCVQFIRRDNTPGWISRNGSEHAILNSAETKSVISKVERVESTSTITGPKQTVILQNKDANGKQIDTCWSYGGMLNNANGQNLTVGSNTNPKRGCLRPGGDRETVRVLMNLLGVANEIQRADRDKYLKVDPNSENLIVESSKTYFQVEQDLTVDSEGFDFNSATMITETTFSKSGAALFAITDAKKFVPPTPYFSVGDCRALTFMYGCIVPCKPKEDYEAEDFSKYVKNIAKAVNCWSESATLQTPETFATISPTTTLAIDSVEGLQINGTDADYYLSLLTPASSSSDIQLTKPIQTTTKLQFLLTISGKKGGAPVPPVRGRMTVDLRCRPFPDAESESLLSGTGDAKIPFKLKPPTPGFSSTLTPVDENLTIKPETCNLGASPVTVPKDYSFAPFPVDSSRFKLRKLTVSNAADGTNTDLDQWRLDSGTETILATVNVDSTKTYKFSFDYYDSKYAVSQSITLNKVQFDCSDATEPLRNGNIKIKF